MAKLNQTIALEADSKKRASAAVSQAASSLGKQPLLNGLSRTYQPLHEDGEQLPPESSRVQVNAADVLSAMQAELVRLFDLTATKDYANCLAKADVVVDGTTLVSQAPATFLLFLEKQLAELETFIRRLPTLDQGEKWIRDEALGTWATPPVETLRTKKLPRNHVKAEATKEHPAQVDVYYEDVAVGRWSLVRYSSAFPVPRVEELLGRVRTLQEAVKTAREEANMLTVEQQKVGEAILHHLFG
jgi:hypothetical protein